MAARRTSKRPYKTLVRSVVGEMGPDETTQEACRPAGETPGSCIFGGFFVSSCLLLASLVYAALPLHCCMNAR